MFTVGLTGGIGSGKSAVAATFKHLGIKVVNADEGSRAVVRPGMSALTAIAEHFGPAFILTDGTLNRALMRDTVFKNSTAKNWLENLLHPLIREWTQYELSTATSPYAILESPLLLEMGQHRQVDRTLVVDVPVDIQIKRAAARDNNDPEQIKAIIAAQLPREERLALADDVIDNTGTLTQLDEQVRTLHMQYLKQASAKALALG